MTVMCVRVFVLDVSMLRECKGVRVTAIIVWGTGHGVVVVSAENEYVVGTRSSGIMSSAADVLGMSVVRGMRGVGGVCEILMCLARGSVGGEWCEWIRRLGLTNPVATGGVLDVCLCLRWCGWCRWGVCGIFVQGLEV